jgi:hypothetical protein
MEAKHVKALWIADAKAAAKFHYGFEDLIRENPEYFDRAYDRRDMPEQTVLELGEKYDLNKPDPITAASLKPLQLYFKPEMFEGIGDTPAEALTLILGDGYPFPYPSDPDEQEEANHDAPNHMLTLSGVVQFEWRFTVTVQFADPVSFQAAKELTGWNVWEESDFILEANTSRGDGREFPAIVVGDRAYCQIILDK